MIDEMRAVAVDAGYGGTTAGVTGARWFDTITAKIDLMKTVENNAEDLKASMEAMYNKLKEASD